MINEKSTIEKNEILCGIKEQIDAFDNKANILITILGIIFALSFSAIELFITNNYCWWVYLFFGLYLFSLVTSIGLSLCVIIPRERKKSKQPFNKGCTYYGDLKDMSEEEFNNTCVTETHFEQIKTNANIAWRKHKFVKATIKSLIPVGIFFIILVILILV